MALLHYWWVGAAGSGLGRSDRLAERGERSGEPQVPCEGRCTDSPLWRDFVYVVVGQATLIEWGPTLTVMSRWPPNAAA
jgi:hypothetical protein